MENVETSAQSAPPPQPGTGFESLPFPVRNFGTQQVSHYRVYKSPTEHVDVDAESAVQAYISSGVGDPYRIVREIPGQQNLIDREKFLETAKNPAEAAAPAAGEAPPATEAAPAAAAEEAPPQA